MVKKRWFNDEQKRAYRSVPFFFFFYSNSKLNRYLKGFGGIGGKIGRD
jgi:hypothetical protein